MSTATLIPVDEYLATTYHPDCDYVDGVLIERNVGRKDHSDLQTAIANWFWSHRKQLRLKATVEQRIRVDSRRFRIPDVCVVALPAPDEQIFSQPPYICIEVDSPDDTLARTQARFDDYLDMGVENIWRIEPASGRAWRVTRDGQLETKDGILRTVDGRVELPIAELFTIDD
jgi:Uma2 family endonuclease